MSFVEAEVILRIVAWTIIVVVGVFQLRAARTNARIARANVEAAEEAAKGLSEIADSLYGVASRQN